MNGKVVICGINTALLPKITEEQSNEYLKKIATGDEKATLERIAEEIKLSEVVYALDAISDTVSLYEPVYNKSGDELMLSDVMGTDGDVVYKKIENGVEAELLGVALKRLSSREREIMELRYGLKGGEEKTQKEVADMLGISQSYISRLEKKIIVRLKKEFSKMV